MALEVPEDTLQSVHQNYGADPDAVKLSVMLDHWLKQPNAYWDTLINAIEGPLVNQKTVADNINEFLEQLSNNI